MINIAIVEDSKSDLCILENYIQRYSEESGIPFHIYNFPDGLDIVSDYTSSYDIIFLDIQMKHLNGMKTAEKIRLLDEETEFVFITSTAQYAVQGYTVNAIGYVLKPVSYLAFGQVFTKAIQKVKNKQSKEYFSFDTEHGIMKLELKQIFYIESQLHYIIIHSEKGIFKAAGPMKKIEKALTTKGFSKCHNSYLLNLYHVDCVVQNTVVMTEHSNIPISRPKKKLFLDTLTDYLGGIRC